MSCSPEQTDTNCIHHIKSTGSANCSYGSSSVCVSICGSVCVSVCVQCHSLIVWSHCCYRSHLTISGYETMGVTALHRGIEPSEVLTHTSQVRGQEMYALKHSKLWTLHAEIPMFDWEISILPNLFHSQSLTQHTLSEETMQGICFSPSLCSFSGLLFQTLQCETFGLRYNTSQIGLRILCQP